MKQNSETSSLGCEKHPPIFCNQAQSQHYSTNQRQGTFLSTAKVRGFHPSILARTEHPSSPCRHTLQCQHDFASRWKKHQYCTTANKLYIWSPLVPRSRQQQHDKINVLGSRPILHGCSMMLYHMFECCDSITIVLCSSCK